MTAATTWQQTRGRRGSINKLRFKPRARLLQRERHPRTACGSARGWAVLFPGPAESGYSAGRCGGWAAAVPGTTLFASEADRPTRAARVGKHLCRALEPGW